MLLSPGEKKGKKILERDRTLSRWVGFPGEKRAKKNREKKLRKVGWNFQTGRSESRGSWVKRKNSPQLAANVV